MLYDAIIVGGSFAGLAAALQLARARKNILVLDAGLPRNRFASHSHGVLAMDGRSGSDILADALSQLRAYPTAKIYAGKVASVTPEGGHFVVELEGGARWFTSRRVLLATGVRDVLPDITGLKERWGSTVLHCPYCHGYELEQGAIGVLGISPMSVHLAAMVADWGDVTLFTNNAFAPTEDERRILALRKVTVEPVAIDALEGTAPALTIRLMDGRRLPLRGLFAGAGIEQASPLAGQLGCAMDETPMGPLLRTDGFKQTTVPGVYAAGDAASMRQSISLAIGDGMLAGVSLHQSLIAEETAHA
ncbi:MAG: NAD(P)/FAD-dependent oxidoreductase [Pseudomonadota bacterium]